MTPPKLIEALFVRDYTLWLRFDDGVAGPVDLADDLVGPVFEAVRHPAVFRSFHLNGDFHTIAWPNGADLAPEFLRAKLLDR